MRYLLDTHILIWYLEGNLRLKTKWREVIADRKNDVLVSAISPWEMSLKTKKLRLRLPFESYFENFEYMFLDITFQHIKQLRDLPVRHDHKDPFDRMLVAQACVENCTLITLDEKIKSYNVPILE